MIARPLPFEREAAPRVGTRSGRTAALRRRVRTERLRYAVLTRTFAIVAIVTVCVVAYLGLMANVTRLNYEFAKSERTRAALADETSRLDDRIERLSSRERLGALAAKLGMHEADTFAVVTLPRRSAPKPPAGIAFLTWLR